MTALSLALATSCSSRRRSRKFKTNDSHIEKNIQLLRLVSAYRFVQFEFGSQG